MKSIRFIQSRAALQILYGFFFLAAINRGYSQELITMGPKVGLNLTTLTGKDAANASIEPRLLAGGFLSVKLYNQFAVQVEVNYTQKGARIRNNPITTSRIGLTYLEIPILARFCYTNSTRTIPYLATGPSTNLLINARNSYYKDPVVTQQYKKIDLGWSFGAGLEMKLKRNWWMVDLRYTPGFIKLYSPPNSPAIRSTVFTLSTAFGFTLYDRYGNRRR